MKSLIIFTLLLTSLSAFAGDINWSGKYQLESQLLKNPNLGTEDREYSYFAHHLVLNPHIIAADGISIHSRFDLFNNSQYPNSQVGEFFGGSATGNNGVAASGELEAETIAVTELYLSWTQQFGSLIAGRAPVQFGLGITHNAGNGEFDHWFDRKDMIGYKFILGNMFIMPMYGKLKEGDAEEDDDAKEYMLQFGYENLDTDLEIGFFFQQTKANTPGNDLDLTDPDEASIYNAVAVGKTNLNIKTYNLFVKKKNGPFSVGIEASMQSGSTGLVTATPATIQVDASAIVAEVGYAPENSKWSYDVKLGTISGDDAGSSETYEGYLIDKNYDIALLMFNYLLGGGAGSVIGNENYITAVNGGTKVDVGQISNTLYFAPGFNWKWSDKWSMKGRFTYAQLSQEQSAGQSTDLGYELDFGIYYRPMDRFVIGMDFGYLMTGDAFKAGSATGTIDDAYGILTKAAVTF